jgi:C-terminal processing protease CtpA/Prc
LTLLLAASLEAIAQSPQAQPPRPLAHFQRSRSYTRGASLELADAQTSPRWSLSGIFGFEYGLPGAFPTGWSGSTDGTVVTDCQVAHSGNCSARIERTSSSSGTLSDLGTWIPIDFSGRTIQWSGWVRTESVAGYAALYAGEEDVNGNPIGSASAQVSAVQGAAGWTQYSVTLPLYGQATLLYFGALLSGTGTAWVDDLQLLVDGQPVASNPGASFTSDHQFDSGSGITIASLSDIQIQNLAVLAKVWGFLKYYHPAVTSGQHQWDYDLYRALPAVLAAGDGPTANQAIADWITSRLGTVAACNPCATLDTSDLYMSTNLDWLSDVSLLGSSLSQTLQTIYVNRTPATETFFVSLTADGNPLFQFESYYTSIRLPDSGYQLLGLFRAWNMVQYFCPNRDVMADDPAGSPNYWDGVLQQSIPGIAMAQSSLAYQQQMLLFKAKIDDTHSGISDFGGAQPPIGSCQLPVQVRFVQGVPVVVGYLSANGANSGLQVGDVIQQLDGNAVADLVTQWTPYYADSNGAALLRDIGNAMTQGACGAASVSVLRGSQQLSLTPDRVPASTLNLSSNWENDLPGGTFQILSDNVAYLKLSSVVAAQSASYIQSAAGTRGLIIDIRNYPSDFVVFTLGDLLASEPVNFVQFTYGDVTTPGAFHWVSPPTGLTPAQPNYPGKVVVLVDEITQSQAEYTALAFRAAGATIVGSTTAGADGDVSMVPLPGGLYFYFSGIGVFYPDHSPTQRVGIVPNIVVTPTIAGIQAGRDEVLDEALRLVERMRTTRRPL